MIEGKTNYTRFNLAVKVDLNKILPWYPLKYYNIVVYTYKKLSAYELMCNIDANVVLIFHGEKLEEYLIKLYKICEYVSYIMANNSKVEANLIPSNIARASPARADKH